MQLNVRWKNLNYDENIERFLEKKIEKLEKFIFVEEPIKAEYVYYSSEKSYKLKINLKIHKKNIIHSEAKSNSLESVTIEAIDKMVDQLRRQKTILNSNK